jgi:hypothetical protein
VLFLSMATINKRRESKCDFFRIAYASGEEKWVAFVPRSGPKLAIREMKKLIAQDEQNRSAEQLASVWYMGKLALWTTI